MENDLNDLQIRKYTIFFMEEEKMENVHQNAIIFQNEVAISYHLGMLHGHSQRKRAFMLFFFRILSA